MFLTLYTEVRKGLVPCREQMLNGSSSGVTGKAM